MNSSRDPANASTTIARRARSAVRMSPPTASSALTDVMPTIAIATTASSNEIPFRLARPIEISALREPASPRNSRKPRNHTEKATNGLTSRIRDRVADESLGGLPWQFPRTPWFGSSGRGAADRLEGVSTRHSTPRVHTHGERDIAAAHDHAIGKRNARRTKHVPQTRLICVQCRRQAQVQRAFGEAP